MRCCIGDRRARYDECEHRWRCWAAACQRNCYRGWRRGWLHEQPSLPTVQHNMIGARPIKVRAGTAKMLDAVEIVVIA